MTRKVRCGNTQKHTKMPEDATPWEELSRDIKANAKVKNKYPGKNTKTGKSDDSIEEPTENDVAKETKQECAATEVQRKRSLKKKIKKADLNEDLQENDAKESQQDSTLTEVQDKRSSKKKLKKANSTVDLQENDAAMETQQDFIVTEVQSERSKKKLKKADSIENFDVNTENFDTDNSEKVQPETIKEKQDKKSYKLKKIDKIKKKEIFQQKLLQKRIENGVTLLSQNQERKIYLLKKKLREKGYPPEMIKEVARKKRREEEIKFRKTFTNKICFHCRDRGHLLSNCPQRFGEVKQVTGVCFKCGSTEHVSYRCQKKVDGYPLAKCFICKEQGHISKECPKNQRGVYIKGGACRECGNVNHLQKDCPLLVKKKVDPSISLYTIQDGTSMDAEVIDDRPVYKKKAKKPKVVKF